MDHMQDEGPDVRATNGLIARAEERVSAERALVVAREAAGRDTRLCRRIVKALSVWLSLLVERRSILLKWRSLGGEDTGSPGQPGKGPQ